MKIKHSPGKCWPSLFVSLRLWFLYLWLKYVRGKKSVYVWFYFTRESKHSETDRKIVGDWRKAFGSKNGVKTETNDEFIAVYRYLPEEDIFEIAPYVRNEITRSNPESFPSGFYCEYSHQVKLHEWKYIKLPLEHFIPIGSYACGTPPTQGTTYHLKITTK